MGLFGHRVAQELVTHGHHVISVRPRPVGTDSAPESGAEHRNVDPASASAAEIEYALRGADALICSLGAPGNRTPGHRVPAPDEYSRSRLAEITDHTLRAAIAAGVTRVVVVGSYLATWDRMHPELGVAGHHPYVAARIDAAERAIAIGDEHGVRVSIVEIPFVFGAGAGESARYWRPILFDRVLRPLVLFPHGGTSTITSEQLAQALVGAVESGRHGVRYPLSDMDLTWREMISHIHKALERRPPIVGVPAWAAKGMTERAIRDLEAKGGLGGLDPEHLLSDILTHRVFVDATESREVLRYRPGGVPQAIRDTARAAYDIPLEPRRPRPEFAAGRRSR